ncbi:MAG: DUF58 domain-containing protein [Sphingobacteriales bacterium]|nr:MAG: DUF58 domain-containing protein [Sphingobacteriales bacterium]
MIKNLFSQVYLGLRWYLLMGSCVLFFVIAFFIDGLLEIAIIYTAFSAVLSLVDLYLLFFMKGTILGSRIMAPRFSLGDENQVTVSLANTFPYPVRVSILEQLPAQFQVRHFFRKTKMEYMGRVSINYRLRPLTRGVYEFGELLCYTQTQLGLLHRKIAAAPAANVKAYPSYLQLKKHQLLATTQNTHTGTRRVRRLGHSMEFEKIKNYVQGDDIRTINWKATARSGDLMVNTYTDAREQQVFAVIDKGRAMKMPFEGMTLLDYAINASLSLLNVVLLKNDRAGLITFSNKPASMIPAERRSGQLHVILETLYKQETEYKESDYEALLASIVRKVNQRSFLLLFTNFETMAAMERQLPYLKKLSARHLVCVVFFQNTLLREIHESQPDNTEGIYIKTIAAQFDFEKKQIVKELRRHGILSILTTPGALTTDVINKYMELKAKQMV